MASHYNIVDMAFVRYAQDRARAMGAQDPKMNFEKLRARLESIRVERKLPPADASIAVVARDPASTGQQQLVHNLAEVFTTIPLDYRHCYVSESEVTDGKDQDADAVSRIATAPTDENASSGRSAARGRRMPVTLTHWITYMIGYLSAQRDPTVVIVSGAFELEGPLREFVEQSHGRAALAYFERMLNKRWIQNGLLEDRLPIEFVNLERYSTELLGTDLFKLVRESQAARQGPKLPR